MAQGLDLQTAAQESPELRIALEKVGTNLAVEKKKALGTALRPRLFLLVRDRSDFEILHQLLQLCRCRGDLDPWKRRSPPGSADCSSLPAAISSPAAERSPMTAAARAMPLDSSLITCCTSREHLAACRSRSAALGNL